MICDLCGVESRLKECLIEGTTMSLCDNCSGFGQVQKVKKPSLIKQQIIEDEVLEIVVPNFSSLIRKARENAGLKQKELARNLAEKESVIHKIESGQMKPSIILAKKLEKQLGLRLIETYVEKHDFSSSFKESTGLTLGDIIDIK